MAKLSKVQVKNHELALDILKKDVLSHDEKIFVFTHFHEGATHLNSKAGAFFTPVGLAWDAAMSAGAGFTGSHSFIDLCSGIGVLAFQVLQRDPSAQVVCVEFNQDYVNIGKKLVPEATWYCADVMDLEFIHSLGRFDVAISNPPFGAVATFKGKSSPTYSGANAEYKVIDMAFEIAERGLFIIPQDSAGFKISGHAHNDLSGSDKQRGFTEQTGIKPYCDLAIDTTQESYGTFKDVEMIVELASVDYSEVRRQVSLFAA